ncbi:alpha/beta superfamily hydrolase/acyltransferase [Acinetobacter baumannii]|nr:alpha/beta superfamily hydrolase/acyltransferase [Acinetobacter baumannii]SSS26934.1 alpha/beta superfamily hydrolase/acyltransferase [Acinetobacter baumannii]SSS96057.1 alpha/beta superfamily hydrolase/acyltransferase [Acinetobacter baumannii]SST26288.1 alpha/beta superfamily hydrolase/acyltransferase [Acinetobacter baumannii]SSU44611.1 alpha/beta superfamily hydrolase/acyltransferase [Acinetobacter baumannii]
MSLENNYYDIISMSYLFLSCTENVEVANELKRLLKNAQPPVILENVGHMPILEAEQLVIQQYVPFLLKVETNQSSKTTTP